MSGGSGGFWPTGLCAPTTIGTACNLSQMASTFNGSLRNELLNEELFDSLADARRKLAIWRYDYNNVRPHSSLGPSYLTAGLSL